MYLHIYTDKPSKPINCKTDKTSNRLVGKFVSSSVVNLSRRNATSIEIELLEKGLSLYLRWKKLLNGK